jgi:hypothetical protein
MVVTSAIYALAWCDLIVGLLIWLQNSFPLKKQKVIGVSKLAGVG